MVIKLSYYYTKKKEQTGSHFTLHLHSEEYIEITKSLDIVNYMADKGFEPCNTLGFSFVNIDLIVAMEILTIRKV